MNRPMITDSWIRADVSEAREKGFHEGKQFAIDVITKAIVDNPDMPMLALDAARKALAAYDAVQKGPGA